MKKSVAYKKACTMTMIYNWFKSLTASTCLLVLLYWHAQPNIKFSKTVCLLSFTICSCMEILFYSEAWKFKQLLDVKYFRKKVFFSQIIERVRIYLLASIRYIKKQKMRQSHFICTHFLCVFNSFYDRQLY